MLLPVMLQRRQRRVADTHSVCVSLVALVCLTAASVAVTQAAVSDDFNACDPSPATWSFIDPLGDASYWISGAGTQNARLNIHVPGSPSHDPWTTLNVPRLMQAVSNTDFQIEIKLESQIGLRNQQQGIIVERDGNRWIRFDFVADGTNVRAFAAKNVNGTPTLLIDQVIASGTSPVPLWLRVTRSANTWTHEWSTNGTSWTTAGSFNDTITVNAVGVYAGNYDFGTSPEFTATFDYFFDTASPIAPEDDGAPGPGHTLDVSVVGVGSVIRDPDQPRYYCDETVALTPSGSAGWIFSNWGGDLGGSDVPGVLVLSADRTVTANFADEATSPPVIGDLQVVAGDTTALVTWTTNKPATSEVDYTPDGCQSGCTDPVEQFVLAHDYGEADGLQTDDLTGNGNDGVLENGAARTPSGYLGRGVEFDGLSGNVDLGGLDVAGGELTIALWMRADDFGIFDARLISKASSTAEQDHWWMLSTLNNQLRFRLKTSNGGTTTLVAAGSALTPGVWTHVAAVYDGAQMTVYQDGVPVGSTGKTGALATNPAVPAWIGDHPGGGKTFDGVIDEVRVYARALDQGEIERIKESPFYGHHVEDPGLVTDHSVLLTDLTPQTLYRYRVVSEDAEGRRAESPERTFSTTAPLEGQAVSDDFQTCDLNAGLWSFVNPAGDASYSFGGYEANDGKLSLHVPGGESHDAWGTNGTPRLMQTVQDTDFQVEVKLESALSERYQIQGIQVEQSANRWLRFDFVSTGSSVIAFAASVTNGVPTAKVNRVAFSGASPQPLWLRVTRDGDLWTHEHSTDGVAWTTNGSFTSSLTVGRVGIHAGNFDPGGNAPEHTAVFDYFFNTLAPVLPEDGGAPGPGRTLTLNVSGNGAVAAEPDFPLYYCDAEVTLTATPDPGWALDGWSGDLVGNANPDVLVMSGDRIVTATFGEATGPPVISQIAVEPHDNWATVTWITNEPADSRVEWGTTAAYGNSVEDPSALTQHSVVLTGLMPQNLYHFRVVSEDLDTLSAASPDDTFTTEAAIFVSEDFNQCELNTGLWTFVDPLEDASYSLSGGGSADAQLRIHVPAGVPHDPWSFNNAPRLMQPAQNTDFQLEVKLESVVALANQEQGVMVEQDPDNWLRFDFVSTGSNVLAFAASISNGIPKAKINQTIGSGASATPMWLRVTRTGNLWTYEYSYDGVEWTAAGSFSRQLTVSSVGVFGGNWGFGDSVPAHTAVFDYFFNTDSPILPEDGGEPGQGYALTVNVNGGGSVTRAPDQAVYYCDAVVELEALPDPGHAFDGWSGDLTGTVNPQTLDMTAERTVTANFLAATGPPVISDLQIIVRDTWVYATWVTNEPATSSVDYGLSPFFNTFAQNGEMVTRHSVMATGLQPETLYYYAVTSVDSDGMSSSSATDTFVTTPRDFSSDDFNDFHLRGDLWTFIDPLGDGAYSVSGAGSGEARLSIHVPSGQAHDPWTSNDAPRLMQPANDIDFQIQIKLDAVISQRVQQNGLVVEQDADNWLRFDFVNNGSKTLAFAAKVVDGVPSATINSTVKSGPSPAPLFLRVTREGDLWTHEYSTDGAQWVSAGNFSHAMTVTSVGVWAGNWGPDDDAPAHTAVFDYFFNMDQPIDPEDGGLPAADTTAPTFQAVRTVSGEDFFRVAFVTDEPTTARIEYGETTGYELGFAEDLVLGAAHEFAITELAPDRDYHFRLLAEDAAANSAATGDFVVRVEGVQFTIFYGPDQSYGHLGRPQRWLNLLGNVSDIDGVRSLTYSLNGEPEAELSLGPDRRRLASPGDFNVELDVDDLPEGPNEIRLTATDAFGNVGVETVSFDVHHGNVWPPNYSIDWSTVQNIQDVAQVVDGEWVIDPDGLRPPVLAYDRLVAVGDISWTDYEVVVPVTIRSIDPAGYELPSGGPGIGLVLRWPGHVAWDTGQPRWGVFPLGALAWFLWQEDFEGLSLSGNEYRQVDNDETRTIDWGSTYVYKAQIQTIPETGASVYRLKVWKQTLPEPSAWDLQIEMPAGEGPDSGCVLLLSHHTDATFGDVQITSLAPCAGPGHTLDVTVVGSGGVTKTPDHAAYLCSDIVTLEALPDPGWEFVGWTGDLNSSVTPEDITVNVDRAVTATFQAATGPPTIGNVQVLTGDTWATVTWSTNEPATSRVDYGEAAANEAVAERPGLTTRHSVTLTGLTPDTLYHYVVTSADSDSQATSSFDDTFSTATETPGAFVSDDFNDCTLDTGLWSFVNPLNDASYSVSGAGTENAHLQIHVPGGIEHNPWSSNTAPRLMQPAADTDFEIEVRFESPLGERYQEQGILIEQDAGNFIRFDFYYDIDGVHAFAATVENGVPSTRFNVVTTGLPPYLRITRSGDNWLQSQSHDGVSWSTSGSFDHPMNVSAVGVFAGNVPPPNGGGPAPPHTAIVDYVFDTSHHVTPEDGGVLPSPRELTLSAIEGGSIEADPDQRWFYCGETVTLTAVPDSGWVFSGWGGHLSGVVNPQTLEMSADHAATASFDPDTLPPVIDNIVVVPDDTHATVTWITNEPATSRVDFGETAGYGSFVEDAELVTEHSLTLTSLTPETLYHFQVTSQDQLGESASSPDDTFSTTQPVPGPFMSEDFNVCDVDPGVWTFVNPLGDASYELAGPGSGNAKLRIVVPAGVAHDPWTINNAPRLMQPSEDEDFQLELKFDSVVTQRYQEQGVIVEESPARWLRVDFHWDGSQVRAFVSSVNSGVPSVRVSHALDVQYWGVPLILRLTRVGNQWTYEYSDDGITWEIAGSFLDNLVVSAVGVFAGNSSAGGSAPAHTAVVDYFFDALSPIVPEDSGEPGPGRTLTLFGSGFGSVSRLPNQPFYYCDEEVRLTATPGAGWVFSGWSGDLTGIVNPASIVMSTNRAVIANFDPDTEPPVIGGVTVTPGETSAVITWITNEPADSRVDYGGTASYGDFVENAALVTDHTLTLTDLAPGTTYHYMITSADSGGAPSSTADDTFATLATGAFTSDDFNAADLNGALWGFVDPLGDASYQVSGAGTPDARLSIVVPGGASHDPWGSNDAPRVMQAAENTDFQIEVKLESVLDKAYQSQGVIVEQDSQNWLRFDFYHNGSATYAFAVFVSGGVPSPRVNTAVWSGPSPVMWLRVTRTGNLWTHEYSFNGTDWNTAGSFTGALAVNAIGLFGGNFSPSGSAPAQTAVFDYVFDTAAPIVPEDGGGGGGQSSGTVADRVVLPPDSLAAGGVPRPAEAGAAPGPGRGAELDRER